MSSEYTKEQVVEVIGEITSPYLGDAVGRTAGDFFWNRLSLNEVSIGAEDMDRLLGELGKGLKVFLGESKAKVVVGEVRAAVKTGRSS
jgi:hypothetical protein